MLNYEQIGSPVAEIVTKTKNKDDPKVKNKVVYLANDYEEDQVQNPLDQIDLGPNEEFQQVPDDRERNILYVTGASGSGKSYYSANYIKEYVKRHSKNKVYLFSSVKDDSVLDKIKQVKRVDINLPDFLTEDFAINDFQDTLLIFDDTDCISDRRLMKKVQGILDIALQTGRHTNTFVVYTSHTACAGLQTKLILNESHSTTFFVNGMGGRAITYLLGGYLGLTKKQIEVVKSIKSRWVTILKTYPQLVMSTKMLTPTKNL